MFWESIKYFEDCFDTGSMNPWGDSAYYWWIVNLILYVLSYRRVRITFEKCFVYLIVELTMAYVGVKSSAHWGFSSKISVIKVIFFIDSESLVGLCHPRLIGRKDTRPDTNQIAETALKTTFLVINLLYLIGSFMWTNRSNEMAHRLIIEQVPIVYQIRFINQTNRQKLIAYH